MTLTDGNTNMKTQNFPTAAVLSTMTGYLVCPTIDEVYAVLKWMTGESVYTHQLARVGGEARDAMIALMPPLAEAVRESELITPENWRDMLATWVARYGDTIAVPRMNADQHERIDPLSELAEMVHPDRIVVVGE